MINLLLDGDWLIYAAGFAGQKTEYAHPEVPGIYKNQTEFAKAAAEFGAEGKAPFARTTCDPLDHVLHTVKKMIEAQAKKCEDKWEQDVHLTILLEGDGNFRSRVGTIKPYKGNRISAKPVRFLDIRNYLLEAWQAQEVLDHETDDELSILAHAAHASIPSEITVICAVDKDMLQVPGWHLNPNKGFMRIGEDEALQRLYVQAATGDAVDNIAGAYKVGPVKAKRALLDMTVVTEEDMWETLVDLYRESMEKYGDSIYGGLGPAQAAVENMRLVYLLQEPLGKLWLPPGARS